MNEPVLFPRQQQNTWAEAACNGNFKSIQAEINNACSALFSKADDNCIETMLILAIIKGNINFITDMLDHPNVRHYLNKSSQLSEILTTLLCTAALYNQDIIIKELRARSQEAYFAVDWASCIEKAQQDVSKSGPQFTRCLITSIASSKADTSSSLTSR